MGTILKPDMGKIVWAVGAVVLTPFVMKLLKRG